MTPLVLLLPFAAVFVLLASTTAAALTLFGRLAAFPRAGRALPSSLGAAVVFAPAVVGALGCVALGFPDPFTPCHCAAHGMHHPHLCASHPAFAAALLAPSACVVGAWLSLAAPRVIALAWEVIVSARWIRAARRLREERLDGVVFRVVDGASRSAVTVGAWSPVILVDRILWDALSGEERRALLHHEHAHVERGDGLTLLFLRLSAALYPVPMGPRSLARWRSAVERACDRHAAAAVGDAGAVAAALVAVEQVRRGATSAAAPAVEHALGIAPCGELEARVMALLDEPGRADDSTLGNDVLAVGLIALAAGVLTLVWPGDLFHHAVETLFGVFVP